MEKGVRGTAGGTASPLPRPPCKPLQPLNARSMVLRTDTAGPVITIDGNIPFMRHLPLRATGIPIYAFDWHVPLKGDMDIYKSSLRLQGRALECLPAAVGPVELSME